MTTIMMVDTRMSERQMTSREWLAERYSRCESAILEELKRVGLPSSIKFQVICIPKLKSWSQVCEIDTEVKELRVLCAVGNLPFFKIPYFVNDVGKYTKMLFREQLRWEFC